jgi:hypothetical protein
VLFPGGGESPTFPQVRLGCPSLWSAISSISALAGRVSGAGLCWRFSNFRFGGAEAATLQSARDILRPSALCRRLVDLGQRLLELLFDAECIGGGARLEFPQGMPIALAPSDQSLMVFSALAEEADDAVGRLAEGLRRMLVIQCAVPGIY